MSKTFEINFGFPTSKVSGEAPDNMFAMYQMILGQIFRNLGFDPVVNENNEGEVVNVTWTNIETSLTITTIIHLCLEDVLTMDGMAGQTTHIAKNEHGIIVQYEDLPLLPSSVIPDFATFIIEAIKELNDNMSIGLVMTATIYAIIPRMANVRIESEEVNDHDLLSYVIPTIQCMDIDIFDDILIRINMQGGGIVYNDDGTVIGIDRSDILIHALGIIGEEVSRIDIIDESVTKTAATRNSEKHIRRTLTLIEEEYSNELAAYYMSECTLVPCME